jgi:hypothetical protein
MTDPHRDRTARRCRCAAARCGCRAGRAGRLVRPPRQTTLPRVRDSRGRPASDRSRARPSVLSGRLVRATRPATRGEASTTAVCRAGRNERQVRLNRAPRSPSWRGASTNRARPTRRRAIDWRSSSGSGSTTSRSAAPIRAERRPLRSCGPAGRQARPTWVVPLPQTGRSGSRAGHPLGPIAESALG